MSLSFGGSKPPPYCVVFRRNYNLNSFCAYDILFLKGVKPWQN